MADEMDIVVEADGTVRFVHSDELAALFAGDKQRTKRASHVEPHPKGGWFADMRPSGGPILGAGGTSCRRTGINHVKRIAGFATRQAALDAERAWLRKEHGL